MLQPTLDAVTDRGLVCEIEIQHLDRGYGYPKIRRLLINQDITNLEIQKRGTKPSST